MSNDNAPSEEPLFAEALRKPTPEARAAFLRNACGHDAALRQRIEALLRAVEDAGEFLEEPPATLRIDAVPAILPALVTEKPGTIIGRYKLLEQIGKGGFGDVYVAEQHEPVKRRVALKIIKLGRDTEEVVARFEAERQALALMDHPNIAKVLDAGATESGRPYFVMELVRGICITDYCDQNNLSTTERLKLFIQVCNAIQHAHQKGVIHRDIKPSNILVTLHDGVPVPKVIDFGIAKATQQELTEKTIYTQLHEFMGTPAYMSPEQVGMSGLDIDTRSDIYSLGVLLYELLVGVTPFDGRDLIQSGLDEMRRIIREVEPPHPSTKLNTLNVDTLTTAAKHRGANVLKLVNLVRGDLDWVVMKCLEKDRTRRYETANGLATDLKRHLATEPVIARPPSKTYRLRRFVRRNRLAFAAVASVTMALIVGSVGSTWQAIRATRAEGKQSQMHREAEHARQNEANERQLAEQRLFDSLVREMRATRMARRAGYRDQIFSLLQQARSLHPTNTDAIVLRNEAVACLGDFVGLTPRTFIDFPTNATIQSTQVDPSGTWAAFALTDGTIEVRQLPSGRSAGRLRGPYAMRSFAYASAGKHLFSVHAPKTGSSKRPFESAVVCDWQLDANNLWRKAAQISLAGAFQCLSSTAGDWVAIQEEGTSEISLVDTTTKTEVYRIKPSPGRYVNPKLELSADGHFLAVHANIVEQRNLPMVDLWNLAAGIRLHRLNLEESELEAFSFSPDGKYFGGLGPSGAIIYAVDGFRPESAVKDFFMSPSRVAFMPGQRVVALPLLHQNRVRFWDPLRNEDIAMLDDEQPVREATFTPNGQFLLTSGSSHACLYSLTGASERMHLIGHSAGVPKVIFAPNGLNLASVSMDRTMKLWDTATGRIRWDSGKLVEPEQWVAFSSDGRYLVANDRATARMCFRDVQSGRRVKELDPHPPGTVWAAEFSSDGNYLATAREAGTRGEIRIWSIKPLAMETAEIEVKAECVFPSRSNGVWSLVFAPSRRQVAFVERRYQSGGLGVYVWDFAGGSDPRVVFRARLLATVQSLSYTPDGRQLLMVGPDRHVFAVDVNTGIKTASFPTTVSDHSPSWTIFPNLSLSPDGRRLAIASPSSLGVDIWEPKTGRLFYSLPEQRGAVWWLAWSPDGRRLAVSRSNGDISIWNLDDVDRGLMTLGLNY